MESRTTIDILRISIFITLSSTKRRIEKPRCSPLSGHWQIVKVKGFMKIATKGVTNPIHRRNPSNFPSPSQFVSEVLEDPT